MSALKPSRRPVVLPAAPSPTPNPGSDRDPAVTVTPTRQLLVSVRNLDEAEIAASLGVDIIDFKDPSGGALAPVTAEIWRSAAARLTNVALSAALGESASAMVCAIEVPPSFRFAKVGPSETVTLESVGNLWDSIALPDQVELVAVAYADHPSARCPDVFEILRLVRQQGRTRLLIDTFTKDGRGLLDHLSIDQLGRLLHEARQSDIWIALAGSLKLEEVRSMEKQNLVPNCWGVRGDVCQAPSPTEFTNRRTGEIDGDRIVRWRRTTQ